MLAQPVVCRTLIGRRDELTHLLERRKDASAGRGGLVLITGEAGIGKTRLVKEFTASLVGARVRVGRAQAREFAGGPYAVVLEALRAIAPRGGEPERAASREAQFDAITRGFEEAAEHRTLVVAIDDLHWVDAATIELLATVTGRAARNRMLFVATYRSDGGDENAAVLARIARLERMSNVTRITLPPLPSSEVRALVEAALEGVAELDRATIAAIVRLGDGNPLFVEELLKSAVEQKRAVGRNTQVLPPTIRAAVLERLQPLNAWEREVLALGAVIGRRFSLALLSSTLDAQRERILTALQRARNLQLIVEEGADAFVFRHALTRETIYSSFLATQLREFHRRIASALESLPLEERSIEDLAYHWWAAQDEPKTGEYAERAGNAAMAVFAYEEATRYYQFALDALPPNTPAAARIHVQRGYAQGRLGAPVESLRDFEAAADAYRVLGDVAAECSALGSVAAAHYNLAPEDPNCLSPLLSFRDRRQDMVDVSVRMHAEVMLAQICALQGRQQQAAEFLAQVEPGVLGEAEAELKYHATASLLAAARADVESFKRHVDEGVKAATNRRSAFLATIVVANAASVLTDLGRFDEAEERFAQAQRYFDAGEGGARIQRSVTEALTVATKARFALLRGDLAASRTLVLDALSGGGMSRTARPAASLCATYVGTLMDDRELATRFFDRELSSPQERVLVAAGYAEHLHAEGRSAEARETLRAALDDPITPLTPFFFYLTVARLGDFEQTARARDAVVANAALPQDIVYRATLPLFDAILAARRGDRPSALQQGRAAADAFRALGCPLWEAEALAHAGQGAAAADIYRRIGAVSRLRWIQADHKELSTLPVTERSASAALSNREAEVAALVGRGISNAEIAARLSVTVKGVEKHLGSIYRKLGISSRARLVAHLAEQRASAE